jgi:redox-sensitive bicupin YhaK (pirin superfamily)
MAKTRSIRKVIKARPTQEGAGVHLNRVFGFGTESLFDPFLLLDDFSSDTPAHYLKGFPWHPHRGIETITYVLKGDVEHGDSMGNKGVISGGDVQWMTAGSGIIHQEMPKGDSKGRMYGFQLWANLPKTHKMMAPRYRGVTSDQIPETVLADGISMRIIAGRVGDVQGPVRDVVIDPEYLDVTIPEGGHYVHSTKLGHTVFAYVLEGTGSFCRAKDPYAYEVVGVNYFDMKRDPFVSRGMLALFDDGDELGVRAEGGPVRFLLISGKPLGEPVAWYGPIVMNTEEELRLAFEEYTNGTFIKKPS